MLQSVPNGKDPHYFPEPPDWSSEKYHTHIILGKSIKKIAEAEGVHEESVRQSIKRGLERMKKTF